MIRRHVLVVFVMLCGTACTTLARQSGTAREVVSAPKPPQRVMFTMNDGRKVDVWYPEVIGDSIVGFSHANGDVRRKRRAEATAEVTAVSIKKPNPMGTAAIIVLGGIATAFAILIATWPSDWMGDGY